MLFIIRRCSPSEHGHFFQATCQSHVPWAPYMGLPTGPVAMAFWQVRKVRDGLLLQGLLGTIASLQPDLPLWGDPRQGRARNLGGPA